MSTALARFNPFLRFKKRKRILFAGHDLKFARNIINYFENHPEYEVKIDKWSGHSNHNRYKSNNLLKLADIVVAEWGLGNAVWYSENKREDQLLIIRMHNQEKNTPFLNRIDWGNVDHVIYISPFSKREFEEKYPFLLKQDSSVIYNVIDSEEFNKPKSFGYEFNIGMIGISPKLKRLDLALSIFEKIWHTDSRYKLYIKGKLPTEYTWLWNQAEQRRYYLETFKKLNSSPWKNSVVFEGWGNNIEEWFKKIGFILSTSDQESFHMAVAEGMATGAIPVIRNWVGANELYPDKYIFNTIDEAADIILKSRTNNDFLNSHNVVKSYIQVRYDVEKICQSWQELFLNLLKEKEKQKSEVIEVNNNIDNWTPTSSSPVFKDITAAVILDDFSYECFQYEMNLVHITPENWYSVLEKTDIDLLLVESAWHGNNNTWNLQISDLENKPNSQLRPLVKWCREKGIPTVFWNKEDPPGYDVFIEAAKLFDYVFTTDRNRIPFYKRDLDHENVFDLPFAAQPRIHNPINSTPKEKNVAFAGSWYAKKHETRRVQMEYLIEPAFKYLIEIYDRNKLRNNHKDYRFPEKYNPYIVGGLPYKQLLNAYKKYKIFLNVNSVTDSPTMFSRRVFEILASGTAVLSSYSKGIDEMFGEIVAMCSNQEEAENSLELLLTNDNLRERITHLGIRKVHSEHTYTKRVEKIVEKIGLNVNLNLDQERVSVLTFVDEYNENIFKNVIQNYKRQKYDDKELLICVDTQKTNYNLWNKKLSEFEDVKLFDSKNLNSLIVYLNKLKSGYVTLFDSFSYYGEYFIYDLILAFKYTGATVVGKNTVFTYNGSNLSSEGSYQHKFVNEVNQNTVIFKRDLIEDMINKKFNSTIEIKHEFFKRINDERIYAADKYNFINNLSIEEIKNEQLLKEVLL